MMMLSTPWQAALARMFRSRGDPLYMPTVLLAVIHLIDQGDVVGPTVRLSEVEPVFDQLGGEALAGRAWQPFFHLSRSMDLWTLCQGAKLASFDDLAAKRPKSRGALLRRADRALIHERFLPELLDPAHRRQIAWHILRQLLHDDTALPQRLTRLVGFPIGRDYQHRPAPLFAAESHTRTYRSAPIQQASQQHHAIQDELARLLREHGLRPLEPLSYDPAFDIAWEDGGRLHVAEVKSLHSGNESDQLRKGLGQVLEYRHLIERRSTTQPQALLVVERKPARLHWPAVCHDVGVRLLWPDPQGQLTLAMRFR